MGFRGKGKVEGVQTEDDVIRSDLEDIQPPLIDIKGSISAEEVTNVSELPRGSCTGTLIPESGVSPTTTSPTSPTTTTTTSPTTTTTTEAQCSNNWKLNKCKKKKN